MPRDFVSESLSHDPVHGYIPFISGDNLPDGEVAEQEIIDHPWVQRLRHIHQLQTAWFVFPSAEHMRFQHVLGAMHLASKAMDYWYESLASVCPNVPSRPYIESLVRMAALLHDVGHGPFGHFFDDQYLDQFGVTHEDIGAVVIEKELGDLLCRIRRNPNGTLGPLEELDPRQIGWLIRRPQPGDESDGNPDWLRKLRALFSGIYTVDNMDFVLRDAYMSGYNTKAFDLSRLLHYSFFTPSGLTIHARGRSALVHFIETRANLFRSIYFHRTVRALDLSLEDIFAETMQHLFQGNPIDNLDAYRQFNESTFLVDVQRWSNSKVPEIALLGSQWQSILHRDSSWKMSAERTINFHSAMNAQTTIFSEKELVEKRLRSALPPTLQDIPLRFDVARHYHRPSARLPAGGQNWLLTPGYPEPVELMDDELFRTLPVSFLIFRVYSHSHSHDAEINAALESILGAASDSKTNM